MFTLLIVATIVKFNCVIYIGSPRGGEGGDQVPTLCGHAIPI